MTVNSDRLSTFKPCPEQSFVFKEILISNCMINSWVMQVSQISYNRRDFGHETQWDLGNSDCLTLEQMNGYKIWRRIRHLHSPKHSTQYLISRASLALAQQL